MASSSCDSLELFKTLAPVGSWLLVVLGWVIVRNDHNTRELRKDVKAMVDSVLNRLDALEDSAIVYFTTTDGGSGAGRGASIRAELKALAVEVNQISDATEKKITAQDSLISLRKAITAGDFDSASRVAVAEDNQIFDDIRSEILMFRKHLQSSFFKFAH